MDAGRAREMLRRLGAFGDQFADCFSRSAQRTAASQYLEGLFKGSLVARFVARRVRPTGTPGERWLLCERSLTTDERKYYLLNFDPTASLTTLVRAARCRWPIEQQYRELKDDLGWDHFEGRTYRGWSHHTVLTAMAFTFLQLERQRAPEEPRPTLPTVRLWVREIMAVLYITSNRRLMNLLVNFQRNPPLRR